MNLGQILIREDKVIIITYKDGSVYTQHKDGTKMFTSDSKNLIIIENESEFLIYLQKYIKKNHFNRLRDR